MTAPLRPSSARSGARESDEGTGIWRLRPAATSGPRRRENPDYPRLAEAV